MEKVKTAYEKQRLQVRIISWSHWDFLTVNISCLAKRIINSRKDLSYNDVKYEFGMLYKVWLAREKRWSNQNSCIFHFPLMTSLWKRSVFLGFQNLFEAVLLLCMEFTHLDLPWIVPFFMLFLLKGAYFTTGSAF